MSNQGDEVQTGIYALPILNRVKGLFIPGSQETVGSISNVNLFGGISPKACGKNRNKIIQNVSSFCRPWYHSRSFFSLSFDQNHSYFCPSYYVLVNITDLVLLSGVLEKVLFDPFSPLTERNNAREKEKGQNSGNYVRFQHKCLWSARPKRKS